MSWIRKVLSAKINLGWFFYSIACFVWFVFRVGEKPTRIVYPCQKVAGSQSILFFGTTLAPAIARIFSKLKVNYVIALFAFIAFMSYQFIARDNYELKGGIPVPELDLRGHKSLAGKSDIFVVKNAPVPSRTGTYHEGLDSLLALMATNGKYFYKTAKNCRFCNQNGIIGKNDVVLIKVNAEWDERGMTNTDILKGIIQRIVAHPDTFAGEVEVVENGQWQFSFNWARNNAEDTTQSMQIQD